MRWLDEHSEWKLLFGMVPALLSVVTVELLVGPEVVELLIGRLVQGVDAQPQFARRHDYDVRAHGRLCRALPRSTLAYYCNGVAASTLPTNRKRSVAAAGIATWVLFHVVLAGLSFLDVQLYFHSLPLDLAGLPSGRRRRGGGHDRRCGLAGRSPPPDFDSLSGRIWSRGGLRRFLSRHRHRREAPGEETRVIAPRPQVMRWIAWSHGLIAMSALLVGSTLLLTLYFRLPQTLYGAGEAASTVGAEFLDFANVASMFWGVVMTLTLVAVYAPHAMALRSVAPVPLDQLLRKGEEGSAAYVGLVKRAEVLVSALAPLLAALTTQLL